MLKYQLKRVTKIGSSEESESEEFEYTNSTKDLSRFDREMCDYTTNSRFERNLLYGLVSREQMQDYLPSSDIIGEAHSLS